MSYKIPLGALLVVVLFLSGCTSSPLVTELSGSTTTYDEIISINNCGNKAESTQTASRSFSTKISGTGNVKVGYKILEGNVSSSYEQYKNTTKTQSLTAAPQTNMEFVLRWSDDVRSGTVTVDGESANYTVNIPVSVAQISSRDLGCNPIAITSTPKIDTTSSEPRADELITVQANIRWSNTGIALQENDIIKISYVSGKWGPLGGILHEGWNCDSPYYSDGLMPNAPGSSLIAKIGDNPPFCVGASPTFTSQHSGTLYFSYNDCVSMGCYSDNTGSLDLKVIVESK